MQTSGAPAKTLPEVIQGHQADENCCHLESNLDKFARDLVPYAKSFPRPGSFPGGLRRPRYGFEFRVGTGLRPNELHEVHTAHGRYVTKQNIEADHL